MSRATATTGKHSPAATLDQRSRQFGLHSLDASARPACRRCAPRPPGVAQRTRDEAALQLPATPATADAAADDHAARNAPAKPVTSVLRVVILKLAELRRLLTPPAGTPPSEALRKLTRRLFTREDWLHLHAASSLLYIAYAIPRTATIVHAMAAHHSFITPHPGELYFLAVACVVKNATSVPMAMHYRRGVLREVFLSAAFIDHLGIALLLWYTPEATGFPELPATQAYFGAMAIAAAFLVGLPLFQAREITKARAKMGPARAPPLGRDLPARERTDDWLASALQRLRGARAAMTTAGNEALYVGVQSIPAAFMAANAIVVAACGADARAAMETMYPPLEATAFCVMLLGLLTGNVGTFSGTLRDRRLISSGTDIAIQLTQFGVFAYYLWASLNLPDDASAWAGVVHDVLFDGTRIGR